VARARRHVGALLALLALVAPAAAWASSGEGEHSVIQNIAICLVVAAGLGYLMKLLRQPLILGYILAGVVIGPVGFGLIADHSDVITIAEIGLILLLFMIGLEIDLKKMAAAGRWVIVPGMLQFPICVALGYLAFWGLEKLGFDTGAGSYSRLYAAIAISLSSTMIVVKLLFDNMDIDTLPGRITVGILVFQDIWAIIVLAVQPNMNNPEILGLARTFGSGALLVVAALAASRYVLPPMFKTVAIIPELMLVLSLGWCFLVALVAAHPAVGLSMEMGALIAGISLATFPYNLDVVAKAISIRDFFITLFFVALGMQIPVPTPEVVVAALVIGLVTLAVRFPGIFGVLYSMKSGHRASLLATINLSQVSEFSLVILSLGIGFGHIEGDTLTSLIWVFSVLAVASTYMVNFSHPIQSVISRALSAVGIKDLAQAPEPAKSHVRHTVVLLGFYRIASALFEAIRRQQPELLAKIKIIDFNPHVKEKLDAMGVAYVYGDISHPGTLHHAEVHHAELLACTIPDSLLKGTNNRKLLTTLRSIAPAARIIVTAETVEQAKELYDAGADYVLEAPHVAGDWMASVIGKALAGNLPGLKESAVRDLSARHEIVA
jgi:Kef-type K+ transport system membrane component KefB